MRKQINYHINELCRIYWHNNVTKLRLYVLNTIHTRTLSKLKVCINVSDVMKDKK